VKVSGKRERENTHVNPLPPLFSLSIRLTIEGKKEIGKEGTAERKKKKILQSTYPFLVQRASQQKMNEARVRQEHIEKGKKKKEKNKTAFLLPPPALRKREEGREQARGKGKEKKREQSLRKERRQKVSLSVRGVS